MRTIVLILAIFAVVVSGRRGAQPVELTGRPRRGRISTVIGGAHFGWGLDELHDDILKEEVKQVSNKKVKKVKKENLPECTEFHKRWHLPCCEHCSDVEDAFDGLE